MEFEWKFLLSTEGANLDPYERKYEANRLKILEEMEKLDYEVKR